MEILTNGFLRANIHQVVSPPQNVDRLSVAFFLSPRLDAELPELVLPPGLAAKARGADRDPNNPLIAHTVFIPPALAINGTLAISASLTGH